MLLYDVDAKTAIVQYQRSFNFTNTRLVKDLCLASVKYVIKFWKSTAFCTSAQSPHESNFFFQTFIFNYLKMSKHRNYVPNSVNIIKLNSATGK